MPSPGTLMAQEGSKIWLYLGQNLRILALFHVPYHISLHARHYMEPFMTFKGTCMVQKGPKYGQSLQKAYGLWPKGWFSPDRHRPTTDQACAIFLETTGYRDVRNDVPRCLTCKYTNANTQIQCIHKYSEWWNVSKPYEVLYFWKALDAWMSEMISRVVKWVLDLIPLG